MPRQGRTEELMQLPILKLNLEKAALFLLKKNSFESTMPLVMELKKQQHLIQFGTLPGLSRMETRND